MLSQYLQLFFLCFALLSNASPVVKKAPSLPVSQKISKLTRTHSTVQTSSKQLYCQLFGQTELYSLAYDSDFIVNVTVGSSEVSLILDTGSSDTWLAGTGFTCVNITTNETLPEADCFFGSTFTPDATFQPIADENFAIMYADGSHVSGILGYDSVTIAGIEVPQQEIAVVNLAAWDGDGVTAGLTGFSWPSITDAYAGTNVSADNLTDPSTEIIYSPIINTIFFVDYLTAPLFTLSLSRNPSNFGFGGYLTIGGVPDLCMPTVNASSTFVTVPMEASEYAYSTPTYEFYVITIDGLVYGSFAPGSGKSSIPIVVDSGTTLNYFPTDDVLAISALYDPPAYNSSDYGYFVVPCNATPPTLGVTIGGETFYHNPLDLIYFGEGLPDGLCLSSIQDGGSLDSPETIYLLGDTFQKNVLSVFDVGNKQMHFSARPYYDLE